MWIPCLDKWREDEVMGIEMILRRLKVMGIEDLQYGDTYVLRNGDSCVYVCRNLEEETDDETRLMFFELVLINTFTGEEHNINNYNDDLTHCEDKQLDIVG